MIPDEAVEAAVVSLYGDGVLGEVIEPRAAVRAALEAAAPHILAEGWDEGWKAAHDYALAANPYREDAENGD